VTIEQQPSKPPGCRSSALDEKRLPVVERLLRFDPLPDDLRLAPSPQAGAFAEAIISRTSAAGSE
jgi:hypothetical protein